MPRRPRLAIATVIAATTAACGGGGHKAAVAPTQALKQATSSTAPVSATVPTTVPAPAVMPLTGLPAPAGVPPRPAVGVKIDNIAQARPQSGVNAADLVFDTLVEGGLSRFFAVYQSQDAPSIGPIRSARPVDADLLPLFGSPIFGYSGAAAGEIAPVKDHGGATLVANDDDPRPFHRDPSHRAPSNVYSSLQALLAEGRRLGNKGGPPAASPFAFGPSSAGTPAATVSVTIGPQSAAAWHWNAQSQLWERDQDGAPDNSADSGRITATNVVVLTTQIRGTGITDAAHEEDPYVVVLGAGQAWVARDGKVTAGTWNRAGLHDAFKLTDNAGAAMNLAPGRTWIELLPAPGTPTIH